jgi:hypothetical protein
MIWSVSAEQIELRLSLFDGVKTRQNPSSTNYCYRYFVDSGGLSFGEETCVISAKVKNPGVVCHQLMRLSSSTNYRYRGLQKD